MADKTSSLIVRLIDQVTGTAKTIANAVRGIGTAVQQTNRVTGLDRVNAALSRTNQRMQNARGGFLGAAASAYVFKRAVGSTVTAAGDFEQAYADVRKVVEFPAEGPLSAAAFADTLLNLTHRLPLAATELTALAAAAGQANVPLKEIAGFVENVAQVSTAFELNTKDAGTALAKIRSSLAMTNPELMLLADHMNVLGNNMATSEAEILTVVQDVSALGKISGIATKHVAAIGAAMTSAGADADSAATGLRNAFIILQLGNKMTKGAKNVFKQLGLDPATMPGRLQAEGMGAILDVLQRINDEAPEDRAGLLARLFGVRAVDAFAPMLGNLELLRGAMKLVEDDTANAGSTMREFEKRNDTFQMKTKLLENVMFHLGVTIGRVLIPALTELAAKFAPILIAISNWVREHPKLTAAIVASVAGLIALNLAMASFKYVGFAAYGALLQLVRVVPLVTAAFATMSGAIAATGIGAIVIALALGGLWIYNNWKGIAAMFDQFAISFKAALGPEATAALGTLVTGISNLITWIGNMLGPIDATEGAWRSWGATAGTIIGGIVNLLGKLISMITTVATTLGGLVTSAGNAVSSAGSAVKNFGTKPITGFGITPKSDLQAPKARGGSMKSGDRAWVGEEGPEIFEAGKSGRVIANDALGGGKQTIAPVFNLAFNGPVTDDTVAKIKKVLRDEVQSAFRGIYSDPGMRFA